MIFCVISFDDIWEPSEKDNPDIPGLSYAFGYTGPCLSVDTICSASLISTHVASQMLRNDECASSLSAGVNVFLIPTPFVVLVIANMLASDGRCKTLDQSGDGYVRTETCGVVEMEDSSNGNNRALVLVCGCLFVFVWVCLRWLCRPR